ncbi:MAG: C69 family dipeptidase [Lachnospiraceae bacterium]|nr:C69 family dipeptidase [Lachnospiraceae bacterium]
MNQAISCSPANDNCSTVIIGKHASKTGHVLVAHNEDSACNVQIHMVPRVQHEEGETLTFADGSAVIPQVKETWAYMWSEFRSLKDIGGEPFSDSFFNEWGVIVVSDSCVGSKVSPDEPMKDGLGYALRRLIAERARTAREGVEIAAALVSEFGYRSSRSYQICDKEEGWVFQVTTGHNYAAQRVADDEIYYIPNWYTIHSIDFQDTEHKNFYWSEDLVDYPMRHGWYTPAVPGDYSDFDFALVYQHDLTPSQSNVDRSNLAWTKLVGEPMPYRTFSVKAKKKYGMENLKEVVRAHYAEHEEDLKTDPTMSPHRYGICRDTTVESTIIEFHEEANLTCIWRSFPRPCAAPFVPWYLGILALPKGYEWLNYKTSQVTHFAVDSSELQFDSRYAYWAFRRLQDVMEFDYPYCQDMVHASIRELETEWTITKPIIDQAYRSLKDINEMYARQILTDYTCQQAQRAWDWAEQTLTKLADNRYRSRMEFWRSKL